MTTISGTNARFLSKEFAMGQVYSVMSPNLVFLDALDKVSTDSRAFSYQYEDASAGTDDNKILPPVHTASADWQFVEIEPLKAAAGTLNREGLAVRINEDAIDEVAGVNEIQRAYRRVGYWMLSALHAKAISAITGGATTPTWTPTATWDDSSATPVDDLIALEGQMDSEEYPYGITDLFVHKTNFYELKRYLTAVDVSGDKQRAIYGMPNIAKDYIDVPVVGYRIHKIYSGLSEGYALALDGQNKGATMFYKNSPRYATDSISYDTRDGIKTVNNYGMNVHQYTENKTHDVVIQFWYDVAFKVIDSRSILYDSGI